MSSMFATPKTPKPVPVPQPEDAQAAADKMREQLAGRSGRQQTLLTGTVDAGAGRPRPSKVLLGG